MTRKLLAAAALLVASLAGGSTATGSATAFDPTWHVSGELLVRFDPGVGGDAAAAAHDAVGAEVVKTFDIVPGLQHVRLPAGTSVIDALARYETLAGVDYAQPNFRYYVDATPNDPQFGNLYGLHNTGQAGGTPDADIDAPEAWDITTGKTRVAVGTLDTGADYNHPDLAAHLRANRAECNGVAGMDDEGNGYVDDCHGIDTIYGDTDPMDGQSHGTHTAGTIGAIGNNGIGVAGVNWHVTIVPCKSHDDDVGGGTSASLIECFQYMETMKSLRVNIVATNNSYGGCPEACGYDQATHDAIRSNMFRGILTVASAGNDDLDNDALEKYPVGYYLPNVIGVASTTRTDAQSDFSNHGDRTVHVGAPGSNIVSTIPNNGYGSKSGTSMAAPHVTGLAALIKASNGRLKWTKIRNRIFAGGDPVAGLATDTVTGRRINAFRSLTCSNVPVVGHLRPLDVVAGTPVRIAVLDINCGNAAATAPTVTITPGNTVLQLRDNGSGADIVRGDGIFSTFWTPSPCTPGSYTFTYSNGESASSTLTC